MIQVTGTNKLKEREEEGKVEGDTDRGHNTSNAQSSHHNTAYTTLI